VAAVQSVVWKQRVPLTTTAVEMVKETICWFKGGG
jgi:hypothetical protein